MSKNQIIIEHIIVTFFQAAVAYLIVVPTVNWTKTVLVGAAGAGLSAVYNLLRQANPTILVPTYPKPPVEPLNGVTQLTQPGTIVAPTDSNISSAQ